MISWFICLGFNFSSYLPPFLVCRIILSIHLLTFNSVYFYHIRSACLNFRPISNLRVSSLLTQIHVKSSSSFSSYPLTLLTTPPLHPPLSIRPPTTPHVVCPSPLNPRPLLQPASPSSFPLLLPIPFSYSPCSSFHPTPFHSHPSHTLISDGSYKLLPLY